MQRALRPYVTTGIAIVGASVIAVAPLQPIPTTPHQEQIVATSPVRLAANEVADAINGLTYVGADILVTIAKLPAPIIAGLLGVSPGFVDVLVSAGTLIGAGPLIGAAGGTAVALQNVVDAIGTGNIAGLVQSLVAAPTTILGGAVSGGVGPNIGPLLSIIPSFLAVYTGGLLNPGNLDLSKGLTLPGLIPAIQLAVGLLFGGLGGGQMMATNAAFDDGVDLEGAEIDAPGGGVPGGGDEPGGSEGFSALSSGTGEENLDGSGSGDGAGGDGSGSGDGAGGDGSGSGDGGVGDGSIGDGGDGSTGDGGIGDGAKDGGATNEEGTDDEQLNTNDGAVGDATTTTTTTVTAGADTGAGTGGTTTEAAAGTTGDNTGGDGTSNG
jgi:hypothetical protein